MQHWAMQNLSWCVTFTICFHVAAVANCSFPFMETLVLATLLAIIFRCGGGGGGGVQANTS